MELPKEPGTVTVVSGTGAFIAPIAVIQELAGSPGAMAQFVEDLAEQEYLYAMAVLDCDVTGIDNTLWFIPVPEGRHGPRIKVAIDPPRAIRQGGTTATVPFDAPTIGPISEALEQQVRGFIELNMIVLLDYWKLAISTNAFIARLRSIA